MLASLPAQACWPGSGPARPSWPELALLGGGLVVLVTSGAVGPLPAGARHRGRGRARPRPGLRQCPRRRRDDRGRRPRGRPHRHRLRRLLPRRGHPRRSPSGSSPQSCRSGVATGALAFSLLLATTVAAWCLTRMVSTAGGRVHRRADADDSPLGDVAALIYDVLRGIHLANGILHGRRAGTGTALHPPETLTELGRARADRAKTFPGS
ncbi:hypothetical protein HBB16_00425 [Pseudonocardia sp. MCCB 268]|nr:hypothetical protein [Pseudonocardia cytotoxica]